MALVSAEHSRGCAGPGSLVGADGTARDVSIDAREPAGPTYGKKAWFLQRFASA